MRATVPDTLRTERLLLRPWRREDAPGLLPVLEANQAHLGPWIPLRISDPAPLPELSNRLDGFAADFAADREWRYGLFTPDGTTVIGEMGLYPRDAGGRVTYESADRVEIGYWLRSDMTGRGLATEAARAVLDVAGNLARLSHAEIRCDAGNAPSAAIPRRLGFSLVEAVEQPAAAPGLPPALLQVWTLGLAPAAGGR